MDLPPKAWGTEVRLPNLKKGVEDSGHQELHGEDVRKPPPKITTKATNPLL